MKSNKLLLLLKLTGIFLSILVGLLIILNPLNKNYNFSLAGLIIIFTATIIGFLFKENEKRKITLSLLLIVIVISLYFVF